MSASQLAFRLSVDDRDEWLALTVCPGSKSGAWFPEQGLGFVDFTSSVSADAARVGLGL